MLKVDAVPLVSIGMPVFNDRPFLTKAIDSLLAQTYRHFELIIADDGSTDGSEAICRRYAALDDRIRYIRHDRNMGVSANMNFLLAEAKGDFFMLAADDDLWAPSFIAVVLPPLLADDQLVSSFCPMAFVDENDMILQEPAPRRSDYSGASAWIRLSKFIRIFDDGLGYGILRKSALTGMQFPVWWGINRRTAYDNLYPPVSFLLARGDSALVGDYALWLNRVKTGATVHHRTPFQTGTIAALFAGVLRKINLVWAAFSQIGAAGAWGTAFLLLPLLVWHWLCLPMVQAVWRKTGLAHLATYKNKPEGLVAAQLVVHLIIFGSLPLISRIYSPEAVGVWGFFQSSVLMLWSFSQIKTDQLMMTAGDEQERTGLLVLGTGTHVLFSVLLVLVLAFFSPYWSIPEVSSGWLLVYWIGFGVSNMLVSWLAARKNYPGVNAQRLLSALLAYPGSWLAWHIWGTGGLILSLWCSVWLPVLPWITAPFQYIHRDSLWAKVKQLVFVQKNNSFWMTGSGFMVAFTDQIFTLVIAAVYDLSTAGAFFFVQRIMMAPVSLMVSTYGLYYYRHFYDLWLEKRLTTGVFTGYWIKWLPVTVIFYGVIAVWGEYLLALFFGRHYTHTGLWVGALALRCGVQFLSSPVSTGFYVLGQPRYPFYLGVFSLLITLGSVYLMAGHVLPLHHILWIHSALMVFNILIYNVLMLHQVNAAVYRH